jgi:hypothetical protein
LKDKSDNIDAVRTELSEKVGEVEELVHTKAEQKDLRNIEIRLGAKLEEASEKKDFATADQLKKSHSTLRHQVSTLSNIILALKNGEDAMLAKKPLGGWSCASCDKNMDKLLGKIAAYNPWNKLPHRDPMDRIARAGPGFSRMLSAVGTEHGSLERHTSVPHTMRSSVTTSQYYYEEDVGSVNKLP